MATASARHFAARNPLVMPRLRSGFAVIGDTQHLPLADDSSVDHLTDVDAAELQGLVERAYGR